LGLRIESIALPLYVSSDLTEKENEMSTSIAKKLTILFASVALGAAAIAPAFAQSSDAAAGGNTAAAGAVASSATPTKAQRKQARKEARAKKNAELKKLEDAGYQPGRSDPNYPQDLQNAQKKAGIGQGASQ
jgi:hypothetical protein